MRLLCTIIIKCVTHVRRWILGGGIRAIAKGSNCLLSNSNFVIVAGIWRDLWNPSASVIMGLYCLTFPCKSVVDFSAFRGGRVEAWDLNFGFHELLSMFKCCPKVSRGNLSRWDAVSPPLTCLPIGCFHHSDIWYCPSLVKLTGSQLRPLAFLAEAHPWPTYSLTVDLDLIDCRSMYY